MQADLQTVVQKIELYRKHNSIGDELQPHQAIDEVLNRKITDICTHM